MEKVDYGKLMFYYEKAKLVLFFLESHEGFKEQCKILSKFCNTKRIFVMDDNKLIETIKEIETIFNHEIVKKYIDGRKGIISSKYGNIYED